MAAAAQPPPSRKLSQILHGPARLQVAVLIREADNLVRVAYINPFGLRPGRIKCNPEGLVQAGREHRHLLWLAVGPYASKYPDLARLALCEKDIAVGCRSQQPRIVESGRVKLHFETFGRNRPGSRGPRRNRRPVVDRLLRRRRRQISYSHMAAYARRFVCRIGEGALPGQNLRLGRPLRLVRCERTGCYENGGDKNRRTCDTAHDTSRGVYVYIQNRGGDLNAAQRLT